MKYAIDVHMLAERHTGVAVYVLELMHALYKTSPAHESIDLLTKAGSEMTIRGLFPEVRDLSHIKSIPGKRFWTSFHVPRYLLTHKSYTPDAFLFPAHTVPFGLPAPAVVTIHDLAFLSFPEHFTARDRARLVSITKSGIARAKKIIAVSESTRQDILREYKVSPDTVVTIPLACDTQFFTPASSKDVERVTKKYELSKPYILAVGTVQRRKNYDRLIAAVAALRERGEDVDLVIVGQRGWLPEDVDAALAKYNQDGFVHMLDYVERNDLPRLYTGAQVVAQVSLYEGFGIPVLEGMACGTPVVISNCSSLPEVAGKAGYQVDPTSVDSIAHGLSVVMGDAKIRNELCSAIPNQLKAFSWEKTAQATREVLNSVSRNQA